MKYQYFNSIAGKWERSGSQGKEMKKTAFSLKRYHFGYIHGAF